MKDRGGADYLPLFERLHTDSDFRSDVEADIGNVRVIALMSPTRQREKALGLSGRQLKRFRKVQRRPNSKT